MRIGILGSGLMGGTLGTIFARAGHETVFSYSHSDRKLRRLAREARGRARAGTPREAALDADVLLLAVHWSRVADVLEQAGDLSGKVIISCSLPMNASDTALAVAHTSSGAEVLARKVRKANVISAFSTSRVRCCSKCSTEATDSPPAEPHLLWRRPGREGSRGDFDS